MSTNSDSCPVTSLTQVYDPTGVRYDCDTGAPETGRYRPLTSADLGGPGLYSTVYLTYTGGATLTIPVGVKAWAVGSLGGEVYVNNVFLPAGLSVNGGGYNGHVVSSAPIIVSGVAGCAGLVTWES